MNQLFYGDNLGVLRESIADESVDLVYLDPPFNSNASYNVLFKSAGGGQSAAQIEAFDDTWHWNESAERAFDEVLTGRHAEAAIMLKAMRDALGENDMMAYLAMMAVRLIELHRVLKPTGSLYLHCDPTASHYLKTMLDAIFGVARFKNEIVWKRGTPRGHAFTRFASLHDIIFYYSKGDDETWNADAAIIGYDLDDLDEKTNEKYSQRDADGRRYQLTSLLNPNSNRPNLTYEFMGVRRVWRWTRDRMEDAFKAGLIVQTREGSVPRYKRYLDEQRGKPIGDLWDDIPPVNSQAQERLGYPTQKPVALLERIIAVSSKEGHVVLDPFCGCGTTVHAAQKLKRRWIGIDVTHLAIALIERRLKEAFPRIRYEVHGVPKDADGASNLAERDKHEFQKWIVATIGGQPYKGGKKGMDRGVDGYLHFRDQDNKPRMAIISVKGGGIKSGDIRDLKGTVEREGAALGIFLTLKAPTREMEKEAASAGLYAVGNQKIPRVQILTAAEVIEGKRPLVPFGHTESLKKATREKGDKPPTLF